MVGLGTMGAGIAEVFARAGLAVVAIEVDPGALEQGMATLDRSLARAVTRGKLTELEKADILGRVRPATGFAAAANADLAVEVVPERMEIKRQVFAELDRVCRPDAILVTSTSSLSVTSIAAGTAGPGRVAGLHFFNPAPVMRLVEVVTTVRTAPETGQAVTDLVRRLGKTPVRVPDRAGFIVNALLLPYLNHAARLLETGYASRADIDAAATAGLGLPMGPLALLDLIGLDTSLSILDVLHAEFGGPRFAAAPMLRRLAEAGLTGRKTGRGFYDYQQQEPPQPPGPASIHNGAGRCQSRHRDAGRRRRGSPDAAPGPDRSGWLAAHGRTGRRKRGPRQSADHRGGAPDDNDPDVHDLDAPDQEDSSPGGLVIVLVPEASESVLGAALATGRPADAVGLHLAGDQLAELVITPLSAPGVVRAAAALAGRLGVTVVQCPDRPGFLAGALLYPHLNDAVRMVQDGYASAADIDTAMTLGCGYPCGPLQLLDAAGPGRALAVLTRMHDSYGDPAFAPAPLLAEHAAAGLAFR